MCSFNNAGLATRQRFFLKEADLEDGRLWSIPMFKGLLVCNESNPSFHDIATQRTYHQHWFCCRKGSLWKRKYLLCFKNRQLMPFPRHCVLICCDTRWRFTAIHPGAAKRNSHWFVSRKMKTSLKKCTREYIPKRWRRSRYYLFIVRLFPLMFCINDLLFTCTTQAIHFIYTKIRERVIRKIYCERARILRPNCKYRFHWLFLSP